MRFTRFVFSFVAVMALASCAARPDGKVDGWEWLNGRPSAMEKKTDIRMPTGYSGFNAERPPIVKPVGSPAVKAANWNELENYNMPNDTDVNAVTVYPMDPAPQDTMLLPVDAYGQLVQQVYFLHGSAHLTGGEKGDLRNLANSLMNTQSQALAVTVVGHASSRVDGVSDPVRRKMINFEMAQKRANVVTQELNRAGLNPAWVQSVSKGDEEPNMNPGSKSQEAADRRVDVFVSGQ
jgi:outer membrane protein OmpA-like peptidoglycan-associated protein